MNPVRFQIDDFYLSIKQFVIDSSVNFDPLTWQFLKIKKLSSKDGGLEEPLSSSSWKNAKAAGPVSAVREEQMVISAGRLETGSSEMVAKSRFCVTP